jgi:alpha-1,6-mannosyltransferase
VTVHRVALTAVGVSIALMVAVGVAGPSAAEPAIPGAPGWPPYDAHLSPSPALVSFALWLAVVIGGAGVAAGLVAVRRGWRPRPRNLIIGSLLAVVALMLMPPIGSTDILDYAVYGRIAALGHSPYVMTPAQFKLSGDPVAAIVPGPWQHIASVYGPLATATQWAASELSGPSPAKTLFWLKAWNALAYLAIAAALDLVLRSDPAGRARAHLLWALNPLMLLAVMAGGHVDGLAAAAGLAGVLAMKRTAFLNALAAGILVAVAVAIKAPFALFGAGVAWAARRSPAALAAAGLGAAAVLVPSYLVAGRPAPTALATKGAAGNVDLYEPWQLLYRLLAWPAPSHRIDVIAAVAAVLLAALLLWRMPDGRPGQPAVRVALALTLAWLVTSPQQRPWFDAMIFPLLAVMPATRLDWIALGRLVVASAAELPGVTFYTRLRPHWLAEVADVISRGLAPIALTGLTVALIWLCVNQRWTPAAESPAPTGPRPARKLAR